MLRPLINYIAEDGKFKDNKGRYILGRVGEAE
jgi:hypothetical protein